jgi:cation transport protein ChaC
MPASQPIGARCGNRMLQRTLAEWGGGEDLWVFAYASLIWRPEGDVREVRPARVLGWHRALHMWSRVNRGTPDRPGLVFALISGGSCHGVVQRISAREVPEYLPRLWLREMPNPVYDPRWLLARTPQGPVRALGFTLSRLSPSFTGRLSDDTYRDIFRHAVGRYGSTLDYAHQTHVQLAQLGIHDRALARLMALAPQGQLGQGRNDRR